MELATTAVAIEVDVQGRTVHKQLAMFEALRRLGFQPENIYVHWAGKPCTVLKEAERTFTVSFPHSLHSPKEEEWLAEWLCEVDRWNGDMVNSERDSIYREHMSPEVLEILVIALKAKGFRVPFSEN